MYIKLHYFCNIFIITQHDATMKCAVIVVNFIFYHFLLPCPYIRSLLTLERFSSGRKVKKIKNDSVKRYISNNGFTCKGLSECCSLESLKDEYFQ